MLAKRLSSSVRPALTAAALTAALLAPAAQAQEKVLRAVMHADVRTLDPMWTTQTIAGIHGMIVYDTLFGNDEDGRPHPQMVGKYEVSQDRKTYDFTLRDGLKFHDGSPVATKDVIASIKRWGARDPVGQRLFSFTEKLEAVDDKSFRLVLKEPYGMVLESLGKTGTSVPIIMREKEALTDPNTQVTEAIGSGPFKFAKEQWVPGSKTVYLKNADYVPRPGSEPPSAFAGGKVPKVDRIELVWIADPQTAMSALVNGEIDFYEQPGVDFLPILSKARGVKLLKPGKMDTHFGLIRLNHLHPPFDSIKARQAMYYLVNQEDFLRTIVGDSEYYTVCHSLLICGGPLASDAGTAMMKEYNPKKALQLFKEAGYKGEPITVLAATDHVTITPATQVLIQAMREAGLNVDAQAMDWGSVVSRRSKKEPPAQGGWNIFVTTSGTVGGANPVLHTWIGAACDKGLFGWPCDAEVEKLRSAYAFAHTPEEKLRIARDLQARAIEQVVYLPFGQWTQPIAYRADRIDGIVPNVGLPVLWNISKK
ncbi:MAG: transporter substrate-binding protein [Microvirga sp.]|jgi:peptide/nickel transport system substrate-binding protein|nr:transporter substrate-binding protein [Microvirga sp.]